MIFSVWAPSAQGVELVKGEGGETRRTEMRREPGGWWRVDVPDAEAAGGYRYAIDGQGPFPDPRSRWQPGGVHGPSHIAAGEERQGGRDGRGGRFRRSLRIQSEADAGSGHLRNARRHLHAGGNV